MNYNEFKDYVKEHVLDYLPEQYKNANMDIRQAVKNNDVVLDGLTIFNPNGNMSPRNNPSPLSDFPDTSSRISAPPQTVPALRTPSDACQTSNQGRSIDSTLICRK